MRVTNLLCGLLFLFDVAPIQQTAQAHSTARTTPRRVASVQDLRLSTDNEYLEDSSAVEFTFALSDSELSVKFELEPNHKVVSPKAGIQYRNSNPGAQKALSLDPLEPKEEVSVTPLRGDAFISRNGGLGWRRVGWARITARVLPQDEGQTYLLEGAFKLDGQFHHIAPDSSYRRSQIIGDPEVLERKQPYTVVWVDTDNADGGNTINRRSATDQPSCGYAGSGSIFNNNTAGLDDDESLDLARRQGMRGFDPVDSIGSTAGCPSTRQVAYLGIATDCTYTSEFASEDDARDNIVSQINVASQVYEDSFNISLVIRNMTVSRPDCPDSPDELTPWNVGCSDDIDIQDRLNLFSGWRQRWDDDNAVWSLLSTCGTGSTVGIAWLGTVCNIEPGSGQGQTVSSTNVVIRTGSEWQVMAHELGHNFGASHDCTAGDCPDASSTPGDCCPLSASTCDADSSFLMNPRIANGVDSFSPCTLGTVCTAIGQRMLSTSCLVSEDEVRNADEAECGNGIVEEGEECDCGGEIGCGDNPCCNPGTCQLRSGATCDPASDSCCTEQCEAAPSGQVCRAANGDCDVEEVCDGTATSCPADEREPDCDEEAEDFGSNGRGGGADWFEDNRTTVIAVASSVGGGVLILIAICICVSCCRRRIKRKGGKRLNRGGNAPLPNATPIQQPQMTYIYR